MRIILAFSVILSISAQGQSKLDSLETAFEQTTVDSTRVKLLHQLFDEYSYEFPSKAKEILQQAIELSQEANTTLLTVEGFNKLGHFLAIRSSYDSAMSAFESALLLAEEAEFDRGYSEALLGLGETYWRQGNLKKAQEYQERNIEFSESIDNAEGIASSYNTLGNINNDLGEYTKAMEYYTSAAKLFEELGNKRNTSIALTNIGVIHQKLENYEKAIDYYLASDSIFEQLQFHRGNAFISSRLATVYKNMGQFEESLSYSQKALAGFEKLGGRSDIAEIKHNVGNLYWEQQKYDEALPYYLEARAINLEIGDSMAVTLNSRSIGGTYLELDQLDKALQYLEEALAIGKATGAKLSIMDSYETLSAVYSKKQDFKKAYQNQSLFIKLRDSLYTIEKRDLANEIEAKYQNEAKQNEIDLLESENTLQALQIVKRQNERNGLIILSIVILIALALIINQYRIKKASNKQLKELDQIKSTFFENISHEFRTPLSLIIAPLKDRINQPLEKGDEHLLKTVIKNAENLDELIKQLLDLAKLEKGRYDLRLEPVEASGFFKVIAASYESLAAVRRITFDVEIPDEDQWLELDKDLVGKICNNLLGNAFKFTPAGGNVRFGMTYDGDLKISVSDTGPGISPQDEERIFDRFSQVDGPHATGTGIGLALTRELVDASGGTIKLISKVGEGSSFEVSIPFNPIPAQDMDPSGIHSNLEQGTESAFTSISTKEQTLLIIEDNEDLRSYLSGLFQEEYNIHSAVDGKEGIDVAKEIIPDLVISDIMMAEMDGLEVCKSLKSNVETDHIPIILLTARSDQQTKLEGLKQGADSYILKPFESEELRVTVHNLIEQRQKLRARYTNDDESSHSETPPFVQKCESIVQDYLSDDSFTVDDFSREIGMSRMQVHRKLKAMTDLSTTAFIRHHRMIAAKSLLEKGEPVSQVAYAVGFSSLSYFSKVFKEHYGLLPSEHASHVS